ncbi:MAG: hypothetical protein GY751_13835 [Bacteroidetes bacterium]|nr:hypothetical protein [Bacteroidota bacterium]
MGQSRRFNIYSTIYVVLLLSLIYLVITSLDDLFDYLIINTLDLDRDALAYYMINAFISLLLLLVIFRIINEDIRSLLGIELI